MRTRSSHGQRMKEVILEAGPQDDMSRIAHISERSLLVPAIKSWVDNCLIPILVKEYFSDAQKSLANQVHPVANSAGEVTSHSEVNQ